MVINSNFHGESGTKMSIIEDFNLNSMPGYASSLKEVLKQTMLSQEVIFRKQVCGRFPHNF